MYNFFIWFYCKVVRKLDTPSKIINFAFRKHKNRPCLIQPDKNIQHSFCEVEQRVTQLIHFFSKKLLKSGDVVALLSTNSFEYFEIRAAVHMSDLILFALPLHLSQEDNIYFLKMTHTKLLFYSVGKSRTFLTAKNSLPTQQKKHDERNEEFFCRDDTTIDIDAIKNQTDVEWCVNVESPDYAAIFEKDITYRKIPPQASEIATFNVSSGTTQKTPKIVQLSVKNWVASLYNYILNADMKPHKQTVFLCTLPFATAGSTSFLPIMLAGITTIIMEGDFSAQKTEAFINQCRVTRLYITPSWLIELLQWCKENKEDFSSLENIIIGTERVSPATLKEAIAFFGPKITVGYGMVEALPPIAMLSARDYFYKGNLLEHRLASVGRVLKGVSVRIIDEKGGDVAVDVPGRIVIRSKTISNGYLDNRQDTALHFKQGWFFSSDFGYIDDDGFLHVLGRESELLTRTRHGRLIFAKELEDTIYEINCVKCCCALLHDKQVVLFVSLRHGANRDEARIKITAYCDKCVNDSLMPIKIIIKESMPFTPLGKLDRRRILEEVNG